MRHVVATPHVPLVVWGPTGCGKTMGLTSLLEAVGYRPVVLDGVEAPSVKELVDCVARGRDVRNSFRAPAAVVLDDIETFHPDARAAVAAYLRASSKGAATGAAKASKKASTTAGTKDDASGVQLLPLVVTCQQPRSPEARLFSALASVRLFPPDERVCKLWFCDAGVVVDGPTGTPVQHRVNMTWFAALEAVVATRDLRRVRVGLEWRALTGRGLDARPDVFFGNTFEATRALLTRRASVEDWTRAVDLREATLIHEHFPRLAASVESCAAMLEVLSFTDAHQPERFERRAQHEPYALRAVGVGARMLCGARDVGALAPPATRRAATGTRSPARRPAAARRPASSAPTCRRASRDFFRSGENPLP